MKNRERFILALAVLIVPTLVAFFIVKSNPEGITKIGVLDGDGIIKFKLSKVEFGASEPCLFVEWIENQKPQLMIHCGKRG